MNKLSKLFVVLMLLLLPNVVFADELEKNHIVLVEKFDISGSKITIEGYSYISHIDNYGKENSDTGYLIPNRVTGNLTTSIVAYTGDWNEGYMSEDTCNDSSKCYYMSTTIKPRNMWYARCTDAACTNDSRNSTLNNRAKTGGFTNNCNNNPKEQCLYENVGFNVILDLSKIAEKFSGGEESYDGDINFKIVSKVVTKEDTYLKYSSLAVYTPICTVNNSKECSEIVTSGDYTFNLQGLTNEVKFDAVMALVRKFDDEKGGYTQVENLFFKEKEIYTVLEFIRNVNISKKNVNFNDWILRLDSKETNNYYNTGGVSGHTVMPDDDKKNNEDYYAIATHVVFTGDLNIKGFKPIVEPITCADAGWGGSPKTENAVSCSNSGDYNQCVKVDNVKSSGDNYIYVLAKEQSSACEGMGGKVKLSDGKYYTKVEVSTNLLFNQTATFTFGSVNPSVVYAGKGFTLGETIYDNNVTWMNANKTGSGKPHYKYTASDYVLSGGSCVLNESFNINDFSYYKYKDGDEYKSTTSLEEASFVVMDRIARSYIKTNVVEESFNFVSCDSNDSSNCSVKDPNKDVKGIWTSNGSESNDYYYGGVKFGKTITNEYNYELYDSYVMVSGDKIGWVEYSNEVKELSDGYVNTGKKYYVDFMWIYENTWPFYLKGEINPSFVNMMDWSLNGTCDVKVKDSYYTDDPVVPDPDDPGDPDDPDNIPDPDYPGGGVLRLSYRYRSISLKDPFPKGKFAKNWKDWYAEESNRNRISDTYNRGIKYRIKVDRAKASLIKSVNGYYNQLTDFDFNGTSDFVSDKFDEINVSAGVNYCGLGFFATDCDKI